MQSAAGVGLLPWLVWSLLAVSRHSSERRVVKARVLEAYY